MKQTPVNRNNCSVGPVLNGRSVNSNGIVKNIVCVLYPCILMINSNKNPWPELFKKDSAKSKNVGSKSKGGHITSIACTRTAKSTAPSSLCFLLPVMRSVMLSLFPFPNF